MWEANLVAGSQYKGYALSPADEARLAVVAAPNDAVARSFVAGAVPGKRVRSRRRYGTGLFFLHFTPCLTHCSGSSPCIAEHGYWFDPQQVGVRFAPLPGELPPTAAEVTLQVWSFGADAPRPITLAKNKKGFWKVCAFDALLAPVRPPTAPVHTAADDL